MLSTENQRFNFININSAVQLKQETWQAILAVSFIAYNVSHNILVYVFCYKILFKAAI